MKAIIASDLHGSAYFTKRLIALFNEQNADKMILLGDILYHGPRNDLPRDYAPKQVIKELNAMADKIICVRGNCDADVDCFVLDFPLYPAFFTVVTDGVTLHLTHEYDQNAPLPDFAKKGDVILFGHTHVSCDKEVDGVRLLNPGSTSIPKGESTNGCLLLDNGKFSFMPL